MHVAASLVRVIAVLALLAGPQMRAQKAAELVAVHPRERLQ